MNERYNAQIRSEVQAQSLTLFSDFKDSMIPLIGWMIPKEKKQVIKSEPNK